MSIPMAADDPRRQRAPRRTTKVRSDKGQPHYPHRRPRPGTRTGILGISLAQLTINRKKAFYYSAFCGIGRCMRFSIARLGKAEALRRALAARAKYEAERSRP